MKVLQFAFGDSPDNPYQPHNFQHPNCVVYSGTHDNDTTRGWFESLERSSGRACSATSGPTARTSPMT